MTTLASGINTEFAGNFTAAQSRVYFTNDFDPMKVWDGVGATAGDAGMAGPAAAPGAPTTAAGNTTAGVHLLRYRYYNTRSLYVSNPSPNLTLTVVAGSQKLTLTVGTQLVASTDTKCDQIIIEMTPVNGAAFYRVGTLANTAATTFDINVADSSLIQGDAVAAITGDYGHEQPPLFAAAVAHRGRVFGGVTTTRSRTMTFTNASATVTGTNFSTKWAGRLIKVSGENSTYEVQSVASSTSLTLAKVYAGTSGAKSTTVFSKLPNRIYWSRALYPEGWKPTEYARDVLQGKTDELRGLASYGGDLFLFGRNSAERLVYTDDPGVKEGQIVPFPGNRGVINQRCIVAAEGVMYLMDRQGCYILSGGGPTKISKPIDPWITDNVDFDYSDQFHGVHDPVDDVVMWFVVAIGETVPKVAICYHTDEKVWTTARWLQGITGSAVVPDSQGQVRVLLGDENGYSWFYGIEGSFDGVPPSAPTVATVAGSPTATSIPVDESLPTYPSLAGAMVYDPATGNTAVIESNTSSVITLTSPGLGATPSVGAEIWLGVIPIELRTKWFVGEGQEQRKQGVYFKITVYPGSATGVLRVYFYADFAETPMALTIGVDDTMPDGVTINVPGSYVEVALDGGSGDGYIPVPVPSDWVRAIQARVVSDRPDGDFRLLSAQFAMESDNNASMGE